LVIKRLDDERPSLHAIGIATDHGRVGTLARNFAASFPCNLMSRLAALAASNSSGTSHSVASLTDDVLKFSHDDTRPKAHWS
jgi:hypothetical protein